MNRWLRWLCQVLGFAAVASMLMACGGAITTGIRASNVSAVALREKHDVMAERYEAAQERAAKGAAGVPAKLAAVGVVTSDWRPAWDAYEGVRAVWVALVAALEVAQQRDKAGLPFDAAAILETLGRLQASQAELTVVLDRLGIAPVDAPPRAVTPKGDSR